LPPLLAKELAEILSGRALWTMLLLICPLIGFSFVEAVSLFSEASSAALQSPAAAATLSPLDGILVPTFGSFYVAVTLLFPFVAIRVLGQEKESGALRLLVQLPYRSSTLIVVKLAAILAAWAAASIPVLSTLVIWALLGGHLGASETANLLFGHSLYGLLVGAISLFAATISDSSATAAIVALATTIGSWVLDFTLAGRTGLSAWVAQLSLTQTLHSFEQGLLSVGLVVGIVAVIGGLAALSTVWLPPGRSRARETCALRCVRGADNLCTRDCDPNQDIRGRHRRSAKLLRPVGSKIALNASAAAGYHRKPRPRGPALCRPQAQCAWEARTRAAECVDRACGRPAGSSRKIRRVRRD
jgi:ABC-type transport system involved in multi-copper enzyme maturation permease subunit